MNSPAVVEIYITWHAKPQLRQADVFLDFDVSGKSIGEKPRAIQRASDVCSTAGVGTVFIPSGNFCSGSLELKDNANLHLFFGAKD